MLITKTYVNSDQHLFFFILSALQLTRILNILTRAKEKREKKSTMKIIIKKLNQINLF